MADSALPLARRVAERLAEVPGVLGVALGGSWATGTAGPDSDIDIGIYYRADSPLSISGLRELASQLGNEPASVTEIGEWGRWINGGAWLTVDGERVDWLYREVEAVQEVIERCRVGTTGFHYQPGHPYAFCEHIYMAEAHYGLPLRDTHEVLGALRARTDPYPPLLKATLLATAWEADFALEHARKAAQRGDRYYAAGCLFRCVSVMTQVLFALNERYWLNEKGALRVAASLPIGPTDFTAMTEGALARLGGGAAELIAGIEALAELNGRLQRECTGLT